MIFLNIIFFFLELLYYFLLEILILNFNNWVVFCYYNSSFGCLDILNLVLVLFNFLNNMYI